jgi:hypothetical protein
VIRLSDHVRVLAECVEGTSLSAGRGSQRGAML